MDEARALVRDLREKYPKVTPDYVRSLNPYRDQAVPDRLLAHLAKAGWPQ
jgi:hypothetical protein